MKKGTQATVNELTAIYPTIVKLLHIRHYLNMQTLAPLVAVSRNNYIQCGQIACQQRLRIDPQFSLLLLAHTPFIVHYSCGLISIIAL